MIAEWLDDELVVFSFDPVRGRGPELVRHAGAVQGASLSADGRKWAYIIPGEPQRIRIVPFDNCRVSDVVVQNTERLFSLDWLPTGGGFFFATFHLWKLAAASTSLALVAILYWLWTGTTRIPAACMPFLIARSSGSS